MKIVIGQRVVEWVSKIGNKIGDYGPAVGFGTEIDSKIVGGVVFNQYNGASMQLHAHAERKNWFTKQGIWMIFDYAFNQAKVNVLIAQISEKNEKALNFANRSGFKLHSEIPGAHIDGNLLVFLMRKADCKWLSIRNQKDVQFLLPAART